MLTDRLNEMHNVFILDFILLVTDLLNMCCSSVLPGGGTNLEYALHSLFEAKGDMMVR